MAKRKMGDALKEKKEYLEKLLNHLRSDQVKIVDLTEYKRLKEELKSIKAALKELKGKEDELIPILLGYVIGRAVLGDSEARRIFDKWDKERP